MEGCFVITWQVPVPSVFSAANLVKIVDTTTIVILIFCGLDYFCAFAIAF